MLEHLTVLFYFIFLDATIRETLCDACMNTTTCVHLTRIALSIISIYTDK